METGTYKKHEKDGITTIELVPSEIAVKPPLDLRGVLESHPDPRWPFPSKRRELADIRYITVHHSAGSRATQNIRWWHQYHTQSKSWSRVGYHFGIAALAQGGYVDLHQMNDLETISWHDSRNTDTVGVCLAGDLRAGHDDRPNEVQLECWGRLCAWLLPQLPGLAGIVSHKRWQATACPGDIERWGIDLVDAAQRCGADISLLMSSDIPSRLLRFSLFRTTPPIEDYKEENGIGKIV